MPEIDSLQLGNIYNYLVSRRIFLLKYEMHEYYNLSQISQKSIKPEHSFFMSNEILTIYKQMVTSYYIFISK